MSYYALRIMTGGRSRARLVSRGAIATAVVVVATAYGCGSAAIERQPTPAPAVRPELHLDDMLSDLPSVVGGPAGDGVCELACGVASIDSRPLPCDASYCCTFVLEHPDGASTSRELRFGPMPDCMVEARSWSTVCRRWSADLPNGWYRATLRCDGNREAAFHFQVDASRADGFSIPSALWQGANHCPQRPAFARPPEIPRE